MRLYDRIYGCLLGGACGDALGAPVEFLSQAQIAALYGSEGITHFDTAYGGVGLVTDDTQMTLFTVEGLICAAVRATARGICVPSGVVHQAYQRWLVTQDEHFGSLSSLEDGWLIREKRLWARRAPGNTCLSALRAKSTFGSPARNDSKGCGTVMRSAPFGLMWGHSPGQAFREAAEAAKTTHGHPSAAYSSGALAALIAQVTQGTDIGEAIDRVMEMLAGNEAAQEVHRRLGHALTLSRQPGWREHLPELGEGWVAEEALAISVLCALAGSTPREAIIAAVNHSGDSDSTGAITGNIVGALLGPCSLPSEWVEQVELRDVIQTLAEDLAVVIEGEINPERLWDRYPGW
jgi:ADP-ribosyl-[dinitrogen reductase] hydrolase